MCDMNKCCLFTATYLCIHHIDSILTICTFSAMIAFIQLSIHSSLECAKCALRTLNYLTMNQSKKQYTIINTFPNQPLINKIKNR